MSDVYGLVYAGAYGLVFEVADTPAYTAPTWTSEALDLWEELHREFGTMATYGPYTFRCLKDPIRSRWQMTLHAADKQADTILDLLRTDAIENGLYALVQKNPVLQKRPVVLINGRSYTINRLEDDDDEQPSIRISAFKEQ